MSRYLPEMMSFAAVVEAGGFTAAAREEQHAAAPGGLHAEEHGVGPLGELAADVRDRHALAGASVGVSHVEASLGHFGARGGLIIAGHAHEGRHE